MRLLPLPGVFQPISDSRMLAARLKLEQLGPETKVLDLCTGSGLLAVVAASAGAGEVTAVDISRRAVLTARLNARLNGVRVDAVRGDLFEPVAGRQFDVIVSNPPYVPAPSAALPRRGRTRGWDAGPRGRSFIDRVCAGVAAYLKPGGALLMVHSVVCDERATVAALGAAGLITEVVFRHDGQLGPLLRARAEWLRAEGLLDDDRDEVIIVRAERPKAPAALGREAA